MARRERAQCGVRCARRPRDDAGRATGVLLRAPWHARLRRTVRGPGRSPLDGITLKEWSPVLTRELLELLWLLEATLALEPALDEVLEEVVASSREWRPPRAAAGDQLDEAFGSEWLREDEA